MTEISGQEAKDIAIWATSTNVDARTAAQTAIKEIRLHGSDEEKGLLVKELAPFLKRPAGGIPDTAPDEAKYAAEALAVLGDPRGEKAIVDAIKNRWAHPRYADVVTYLTGKQIDINNMGTDTPAEAIRKLDQQAKEQAFLQGPLQPHKKPVKNVR